MKKKIFAALCTACCLISMVGCNTTREVPESTAAQGIDTVLDMNDLEDGGYYILREDTYERLYAQDANYDISSVNTSSSSPSRTLWYRDDWGNVPTMYKGDQLVYKTTSTLNETVSLERFEYVGYTVGISGLQQTDSGRYSYSTDESNMNINPSAADAKELLSLPTEKVIIDKVGGAYLREGNISSGGCILGLQKDKTYLIEAYAGTIMYEFKLKANNLALTSMEYYKTVEYDFMQSQIISIHIPEYFNSGYYLISNFGLVRYVNGLSYDDDTDFNIPNVEPGEEDLESASESETMPDSDNYESKNVNILADGAYNFYVTYENNDFAATAPTVILYANDIAYNFDLDRNAGELTKAIDLTVGTYELRIYDMDGRSYAIDFERYVDEPATTFGAIDDVEPENETSTDD